LELRIFSVIFCCNKAASSENREISSFFIKNKGLPVTLLVAVLSLCTFFIHVQTSSPTSPAEYDRALFGSWPDIDRDCQNLRHEILLERAIDIVELSHDGCRAVSGKWLDPYTGNTFTRSSELDIDHLVPLKYSWDRGASSWNAEKRMLFSNDLKNLFAVQQSANREKGASGPAEWLPPNVEYRCQYIQDFQTIIDVYGLEQTEDEKHLIKGEENRYCQ
jgi:hypothetical protein